MLTLYAGGFYLAVLSVIAVVHAYWAVGGLWPARDEAALVRTVIGTHRHRMPAWYVTLPVAGLILLAGLLAAARGLMGWDSMMLLRLPLAGLTVIFAARGLITYLPNGPFAKAAQPFRSLNRQWFSPLVLILAAGFAWLTVSPATP